jgi:hypothetical protein
MMVTAANLQVEVIHHAFVIHQPCPAASLIHISHVSRAGQIVRALHGTERREGGGQKNGISGAQEGGPK